MGFKKKSNSAVAKKNHLNNLLHQNRMNLIYRQGENIGYTEATIIMLWLLHTEYGFGKVRLARFLKQILVFCEAYIAVSGGEGEWKGIGLEDMTKALKDECDIDIDCKRGLINIEGILIVDEQNR